jgi:hypothetical protein
MAARQVWGAERCNGANSPLIDMMALGKLYAVTYAKYSPRAPCWRLRVVPLATILTMSWL